MQRPSKEQIRLMPKFSGVSLNDITVVTNADQAKLAAAELSKHSCLGFDTESKPCFNKGESSKGPHLIQISSPTKAYLFPTQFPDTMAAINSILSDPNIKKVGFGLVNDNKILNAKFGVRLVNAEEIGRASCRERV